MLKLLTITSLLTTNLTAKSLDDKVKSFEKHRLTANPNVQLKSLDLAFKKNLEDGWTGYLFRLDLKYQGNDVKTNDILFSNGNLVTPELRNLKGLDLKRKMHPELDKRYYQSKRLVAGNPGAKHKLVIFSDPLCPNCTATMPSLIKDVNANPNTFALYHISMPLDRLHPTARVLSRAALIAHQQGIKDVDYRLYSANFEKVFDPYKEKNEQVALDAFNKVFNTDITLAQTKNSYILKELEEDIKLSDEAFIQGTPTLFLDGEVDLTRSQYKKYIK
jgi:thiol:disulfide interchange protein DsbC